MKKRRNLFNEETTVVTLGNEQQFGADFLNHFIPLLRGTIEEWKIKRNKK